MSPSAAGREGGDRRALRVHAGGVEAAVPLGALVEVCRPLPLEPTSDAPPGVLGVLRWRGLPVPLVDLAVVLGAPPTPIERLLILRVEDRCVAVGVTGVRDFVVLEDAVPLPPLLAGSEAGVVRGLARLDGALVRVLDGARLVPPADAP